MGAAAEKVWIPEISDQRLNELASRIKATHRFDDELRYIQPVDLRRAAYTWDPKPAEKAESLSPIIDIRTYHSYGAPNFFKPSIAEVIAQIPDEHLAQVIAFEMVDSPDDVDDLNKEPEALNAGYHVASVRLYRAA